jgi:translocation and assembly module TamB
MSFFAWLLRLLALLVVLIIVVPVALVIALNSQAGRDFAVRQINQRSNGLLQIAGLGGHFPADLKIAGVTVADKHGVWLTADNLELRWDPGEVLSRRLHVTALTAGSVDVTRAPVASPGPQKKSSGFNIYHFRARLDHVAIQQLNLGAALAGQPLHLTVSGDAHAETLTKAGIDLIALAANHQGSYRLAAAIDDQNVDTSLHVSEPPDGPPASRQLHGRAL